MWQRNFITKCDRLLLKSSLDITKCERLLLQSPSGTANCGRFYYKVCQVLQNVTVVTKWVLFFHYTLHVTSTSKYFSINWITYLNKWHRKTQLQFSLNKSWRVNYFSPWICDFLEMISRILEFECNWSPHRSSCWS